MIPQLCASLAILLTLAAAPGFGASLDGGIAPADCSLDGGSDAGCGPGAKAGEGSEDIERELEKAISKDAAAGSRTAGTASGSGAHPPAPSDSSSDAPPPAAALARGSQSLNPDLSVIIDANLGYERRTPSFRNSLDPILKSGGTRAGLGPAVQEVEVAASSIVDPYFKAELYLSIPNLNALEVEEAIVTTTSLPWNLQVKAGTFRSAFGRQNGQHTHVQDFTQRPLFYTAFLGEDGFRGPGAQVSWLAPLPFFLTLYAEVFDLRVPDPGSPVATFGGGSGTDLSYATEAKAFLPVSEDWSLYGGISGATGVSAAPSPVVGLSAPVSFGRRSFLAAADLFVKWKPPNVAEGYHSMTWQSEVVFRHLAAPQNCSAGAEAVCGEVASEWDGGLYSQIVYQLGRQWFLGVRGDLLGMPTSLSVPQVVRGSSSLTYVFSEFARLRLHAEVEHTADIQRTASGFTLSPAEVAGASPPTSFATYLQLEISAGAHGAHPF